MLTSFAGYSLTVWVEQLRVIGGSLDPNGPSEKVHFDVTFEDHFGSDMPSPRSTT
jgi:hypothetical protein